MISGVFGDSRTVLRRSTRWVVENRQRQSAEYIVRNSVLPQWHRIADLQVSIAEHVARMVESWCRLLGSDDY